MNKLIKVILIGTVLVMLTACVGHAENRDKNYSYDYLLHLAVSTPKIADGCSPITQ